LPAGVEKGNNDEGELPTAVEEGENDEGELPTPAGVEKGEDKKGESNSKILIAASCSVVYEFIAFDV